VFLLNKCLYTVSFQVFVVIIVAIGTGTFCAIVSILTGTLWFSLGTPVSSTNKTDRHDITEILLKVALNTITITTLGQGPAGLVSAPS
jgi:hypothetical protein